MSAGPQSRGRRAARRRTERVAQRVDQREVVADRDDAVQADLGVGELGAVVGDQLGGALRSVPEAGEPLALGAALGLALLLAVALALAPFLVLVVTGDDADARAQLAVLRV